MELTVEKRERLLGLLNSEYTIPDEYVECVKIAVKQYATKNYFDEVIANMVDTPQSLSKGLSLLRERNGKSDLSLFRGIISEWLVCAEYNALKNKGAVVMTITNPDSSSKADLLHIIDIGDSFKAVAGPDVKSGGSTYVFNQWKKIIKDRYEIPMVDIDGILTTEEGLKQLTKRQKLELDEFYKNSNKRPIPTSWDKEDINRVIADYLKLIEFDIFPSTESELSIKDINVTNIKQKLYNEDFSNKQTYDWTVYCEESRNVLNNSHKIEKNEEKNQELKKDKKLNELINQVSGGHPQKEKKSVRKNNSLGESVKIFGSFAWNFVKNGSKSILKYAADNPQIVAGLAEYIISVLEDRTSSQSTSRSYNTASQQREYNYGQYDSFNLDDFSQQKEIDSSKRNVTNVSSSFKRQDNHNDSNENLNSRKESISTSHHDYPEKRKSPRAHLFHRNGLPVGARGGTEEERAAIRKEHGLE